MPKLESINKYDNVYASLYIVYKEVIFYIW